MASRSEKLPLVEAETAYIKTTKARLEKKQSSFVIFVFVILIVVVATGCAYLSWKLQNTKYNNNKPSFNPPPRADLAKTARYIAHYMDWCVMSTISIQYHGIPFGVPISISDGPVNNSTGVPYIYIAPAAPSASDLKKNGSSSFTFSEAMSDYCSRNSYDPEDPRCARLVLLGKVVKLTADEIPFAKEALFSRHPVMKYWPPSHKFFFAKLVISNIHVLDTFGPAHEVSLKDYFGAKI
ncbi:protein CREG1-like isoform X2 [Dendronephthya gigantea]|uniref:protein CREG1-like isoform X2 n=1 Tax=Dendronephthya gigantea TaxID=151771 RepID=UPI00106BE8F8|nr:protein CREG1-like isoform X2 [Dendronephthya gigantea]